jgi:hypothetical protein
MSRVFRPSYSGQRRTDFEENQTFSGAICRRSFFGASLVPGFEENGVLLFPVSWLQLFSVRGTKKRVRAGPRASASLFFSHSRSDTHTESS